MKCEICGAYVYQPESYSYTDEKRGFISAPVHRECIWYHIKKYFGEDKIKDPEYWKNKKNELI